MRLQVKSTGKEGRAYFDDADIWADGADDGDKGFGTSDVDRYSEIGFLGEDYGYQAFC